VALGAVEGLYFTDCSFWVEMMHPDSLMMNISMHSGSGISTLSTSEYAQEMPSSLSAPVSDLDPPDVKDGQRR
jgi:hypothetical protein